MILGKNIIAVNQSKEMMDLLFDLEYKIMVAKDCIECIRHTIRFQPDLVVADVSSPQLNGISMAKILNTLMIKTPIILTASDIKYKKPAISYSNVIGFLLNPVKSSGITRDQARSELESIIFSVDKINVQAIDYSYSFRQHEWANLLGKTGKPRILIIEDDTSVRFAMLRLLDSVGLYDLFSADNGLSGLFKALLIDPHLVLTDVSMPNLDGLAMCEMFYILNKPFAVAFITSLGDPEIFQKAKKAHGVVGLVEKNILQDRDLFLSQMESFYQQAAKNNDNLQNILSG